MKLIMVNAIVPLMQPSKFEYVVLLNRTCEEVLAAAHSNLEAFILPFVTTAIELAPDYSSLRDAEWSVASRVLLPWYIGNFENPQAVIEQTMLAFFGTDFKNVVKLQGDL